MVSATLFECNCSIKNREPLLGTAGTLCHHSSHPEIMQAHVELYEMLAGFDTRVDMKELLSRPATDAMDYYMRTVMEDDYNLIQGTERAILMSGFLRHYAIALLVLQRRIAKYVVLPFVLGCQWAIAVASSHLVVRFKLFAKIALPEEPSL